MAGPERVLDLGEIGAAPVGGIFRVCALLEDWRQDAEEARGTLRDETGRCPLRLDLRARPELSAPAAGLLDGFVLGLRAALRQEPVSGERFLELLGPQDLLEVQRFVRPGQDLARFAGQPVTVSGDIARIGWRLAAGSALLLLTDGDVRAVEPERCTWVQVPYLQDAALLQFAREVDRKGFVALRGVVRPLSVATGEALYPAAEALFRGVAEPGRLLAVEVARAEDLVGVEEGVPLPRVSTNCGLGVQLGCQIQCCTHQVALSDEEVGRGLAYTEIPGGIRYLLREADGYCYALDRRSGGCQVYERRPQACRDFSCAHDPAILRLMSGHGPLESLPMFVRLD